MKITKNIEKMLWEKEDFIVQEFEKKAYEIDFDRKYFYLYENDKNVIREGASFSRQKLYQFYAYYVSVLNNLSEGNYSIRKKEALYQSDLGKVFFKNKLFQLFDGENVFNSSTLIIKNEPKSLISYIVSKTLIPEKKLSTNSKDVIKEANANSNNKDYMYEGAICFDLLEHKDNSSDKLKELVIGCNNLMITELLEDSFQYMAKYLNAHKNEEKIYEMKIMSSLFMSSSLMSKAALNLICRNLDFLGANEFVGSFLISLMKNNVPIFHLVKETDRKILAEKIIKARDNLIKILPEKDIKLIDTGLTYSVATNSGAISLVESNNNKYCKKILEICENFFDDEDSINKYNIDLVEKNNRLRDNFKEMYQLDLNKMTKATASVDLKGEGYEDDIQESISDIIKRSFEEQKLNQESLKKLIEIKVSFVNEYENLGLSKNPINVSIFDKTAEIFISECLNLRYSNIKAKARSNSLGAKQFISIMEDGAKKDYKTIKSSQLLNNYRLEGKNKLSVFLDLNELKNLDEIEKFVSTLKLTYITLFKKAIKDSQKALEKSAHKFSPNEEAQYIVSMSSQTIIESNNKVKDYLIKEYRAVNITDGLDKKEDILRRKVKI